MTQPVDGRPSFVAWDLSVGTPNDRALAIEDGVYVGILSRVAEALSAVLGVATPTFAVESNSAVNAMLVSIGDGETVLVVSTGMLDRLRPDEAAAVVAHELAHLAYDDPGCPVSASSAATLWERTVGRIGACIWAFGNRRREYRADALAAELVGVDALLGALRKSGGGERDRWFDTHPPAAARIGRLERQRRVLRNPRWNQAGFTAFYLRRKPRYGRR
jgi:heat shock protein HtpX